MTKTRKCMISGWALAAASILLIGFSMLTSSCKEEESKLIILAYTNVDTIAPLGHVMYDVTAWSTIGANVTKVSVTEMSDEQGLRLVESRDVNAQSVKERFDYQASDTVKDTSSFIIIFNAEDNAGNTQEYQRRLAVIRPKKTE